jgi:hypothetical protein
MTMIKLLWLVGPRALLNLLATRPSYLSSQLLRVNSLLHLPAAMISALLASRIFPS